MKRQSNVVLRVYVREFDDNRGKGKAYRVRTFGLSKLDRILLEKMLKHHFEGDATEDDVPYAIWQTTSSEEWEVFADKPLEEWTNLQRAAHDSALVSLSDQPTWQDIHDGVACFVDGYEEGYKQAQKDWGLPIKSVLYPEVEP